MPHAIRHHNVDCFLWISMLVAFCWACFSRCRIFYCVSFPTSKERVQKNFLLCQRSMHLKLYQTNRAMHKKTNSKPLFYLMIWSEIICESTRCSVSRVSSAFYARTESPNSTFGLLRLSVMSTWVC